MESKEMKARMNVMEALTLLKGNAQKWGVMEEVLRKPRKYLIIKTP